MSDPQQTQILAIHEPRDRARYLKEIAKYVPLTRSASPSGAQHRRSIIELPAAEQIFDGGKAED